MCVLLLRLSSRVFADYDNLVLFGEALRTLLFPFEWPHVYVPILPASMLQLTDSPVPYIMGFYYGTQCYAMLYERTR